MKKSIAIFLLAVLAPSLVLGWLALRSAEEQQIILERRTAELYQKETDAVAEAVRAVVDDQRRAFTNAVRTLLTEVAPENAARDFTTRLPALWPRKAMGFALGADGNLVAPSAQAARQSFECQQFLMANGSFLSGKAPAQVYWVSAEDLNRPDVLRKSKAVSDNKIAYEQAEQQKQDLNTFNAATKSQLNAAAPGAAPAPSLPAPISVGNVAITPLQAQAPADRRAEETIGNNANLNIGNSFNGIGSNSQATRNVSPQRVMEDNNAPVLSQLTTATADFRALTADSNEGVITRFEQDRLDIIFWLRPVQAPQMIFGCLVQAASLADLWPTALPQADWSSRYPSREFVLALLDDKARPMATQPMGEKGRDWKRPFVATEIGEALPHWEATLYLLRPQQLQENARGVRRTLTLLIVAALGAIACGGWLVVSDARRQMALAQQKTDFVSNVSHELKTPLTSIRMFAELMQNGADVEKRRQYLRIIMFESERLTRLINNVLDFARLERRQKSYDKRPLDLHELLARTWESHELHLRESGFTTRWEAAPAPYPVVGDADALAQILVNLLSNAEKYCGERKEVELRTTVEDGRICVSVLDRGLGVPAGEERKIFEAFHRGHDSLASGIQGSGLGLTLAQRMAREHGGEISYAAREGGGSVFTLCLPLVAGA